MTLGFNQTKYDRIYEELEDMYKNLHERYREEVIIRSMDIYIYLREYPKKHTLSELAEVFGVSKQTMKRYTDLLYMVGLIEKKKTPGGGTQVFVI